VPKRRLFTGWGGTAPTTARYEHVDETTVAAVIKAAGSRGLVARGLGRSYGDAAQNAGGLVVEFGHTIDEVLLDRDTSSVTVSAGLSLDSLMRELLPHGFFVPVTPGTRFVTLGGAIAADIHGKNHHRDGSLGSHVRWLELVDGNGALRRLDPVATPAEFWATVGGMGLTGVITRASLSLRRVESAWMRADTERAPNLDCALELMTSGDDGYAYSVAWIDLLTTGASMGRSVLTRGEHARVDELPGRLQDRPLAFAPGPRITAPPVGPFRVINPLTIRMFNELWYRKAPRSKHGQITSLSGFFHPLDGVTRWNRLYGPKGFVQYQFVVPDGAEDVVRDVVRRIAGAGQASFLAVLKRFGAANPAPLSFPIRGWTLALDLPVTRGLGPLLDHLDGLVVSAGGRIYLAKDSRTKAADLAVMYPRLDEFRQVRRTLDPQGVFQSDLARRLRLN
jgi:decaprenylphospho-beta-D-ribofuranose 2-oxidase